MYPKRIFSFKQLHSFLVAQHSVQKLQDFKPDTFATHLFLTLSSCLPWILSNQSKIPFKITKNNPQLLHLSIMLTALSYIHQRLYHIQSNLPMFALICELPSSPCGWLRLINNNSSWLGRNNSPKTKRLWIKTTRHERDRRRRKPPLPMLPSVLMSANWSFVTQIGADEVQRRTAVRRQRAVSFRGARRLWCVLLLLLWYERSLWLVERAYRTQRASGEKERPGHNRKKSKNPTLERSSGRDSYSCKDHTTSHMYSSCRDNRALSGVEHLLAVMLEVSSQYAILQDRLYGD